MLNQYGDSLKFCYGLDFGFVADPTAIICCAVNEETKELWIYDGFDKRGMTNEEIYKQLVEMQIHKAEIYCDCAEQKSIEEWEEGHTHLESFNMAKTIIDNVIKHKKPKTKNLYLLQSHIRLTDDPSYVKFINELVDAKKNKRKTSYRNGKQSVELENVDRPFDDVYPKGSSNIAYIV